MKPPALKPIPALCAAMLISAWLHAPVQAQDAEASDLDTLRKAARSALSDNSATDPHQQHDHHEDRAAHHKHEGHVEFFAMQACLLAVVLVLHTYTGMHIIRRGIIFCDLVLDQLAAFGVVAGIGLGIRYGSPLSYAMAMGATLVGCVLLAVIRPRNRLIPNEAVIGIMYGMALVACLLLADKLPTGGTDIKNTLVGSMSWVSWRLVGVTAGAYSLLLLFHYTVRKQIIGITESGADGKERTLWDFLFFLSQGIITILIVPVAGVLLAYGFMMIPAAIGIMITRRWRAGLLAGWSSGMAACLLGLWFSYRSNSPYGPSLVMAMGLLFLLVVTMRAVMHGHAPDERTAP